MWVDIVDLEEPEIPPVMISGSSNRSHQSSWSCIDGDFHARPGVGLDGEAQTRTQTTRRSQTTRKAEDEDGFSSEASRYSSSPSRCPSGSALSFVLGEDKHERGPWPSPRKYFEGKEEEGGGNSSLGSSPSSYYDDDEFDWGLGEAEGSSAPSTPWEGEADGEKGEDNGCGEDHHLYNSRSNIHVEGVVEKTRDNKNARDSKDKGEDADADEESSEYLDVRLATELFEKIVCPPSPAPVNLINNKSRRGRGSASRERRQGMCPPPPSFGGAGPVPGAPGYSYFGSRDSSSRGSGLGLGLSRIGTSHSDSPPPPLPPLPLSNRFRNDKEAPERDAYMHHVNNENVKNIDAKEKETPSRNSMSLSMGSIRSRSKSKKKFVDYKKELLDTVLAIENSFMEPVRRAGDRSSGGAVGNMRLVFPSFSSPGAGYGSANSLVPSTSSSVSTSTSTPNSSLSSISAPSPTPGPPSRTVLPLRPSLKKRPSAFILPQPEPQPYSLKLPSPLPPIMSTPLSSSEPASETSSLNFNARLAKVPSDTKPEPKLARLGNQLMGKPIHVHVTTTTSTIVTTTTGAGASPDSAKVDKPLERLEIQIARARAARKGKVLGLGLGLSVPHDPVPPVPPIPTFPHASGNASGGARTGVAQTKVRVVETPPLQDVAGEEVEEEGSTQAHAPIPSVNLESGSSGIRNGASSISQNVVVVQTYQAQIAQPTHRDDGTLTTSTSSGDENTGKGTGKADSKAPILLGVADAGTTAPRCDAVDVQTNVRHLGLPEDGPKLTREHIMLRRKMQMRTRRDPRVIGGGGTADNDVDRDVDAMLGSSLRCSGGADGVVIPPRNLSLGVGVGLFCVPRVDIRGRF